MEDYSVDIIHLKVLWRFFFPLSFSSALLWNDSLSSIAAPPSVSHTYTSQSRLLSISLSLSLSFSLTYSQTVLTLSCSLRKQVEGWVADYGVSRSREKQTLSKARVWVLIAFAISNALISTCLASADVYKMLWITGVAVVFWGFFLWTKLLIHPVLLKMTECSKCDFHVDW